MIVIPAIDLRGGRCVRLRRGDPAAETEYPDDPLEAARRFETEGARRLHVVDLDAALGTGSNRETVAAICRAVAVRVQAGGGLHTHRAVEEVLAAGVARAVLGSAALQEPSFVREAVERFGDRIVVAADIRGDRVMVRGWQEEGRPMDQLIPELEEAGTPRFLITSIEMDGTLEGPDLDLYDRAMGLTTRPVIASGGVRTAADVRALSALGVEGVVVGKALYEKTLRLPEVTRG